MLKDLWNIWNIWNLFQQFQIGESDQKLDRGSEDAAAEAATVRVATELNEKVDRLALVCRAMFELMQQTAGITDEQLKAKITEIDLRDGQADGRMTAQPKRCPKCAAMMSPRFGRCLFCGYRDESASPFGT